MLFCDCILLIIVDYVIDKGYSILQLFIIVLGYFELMYLNCY